MSPKGQHFCVQCLACGLRKIAKLLNHTMKLNEIRIEYFCELLMGENLSAFRSYILSFCLFSVSMICYLGADTV